MTEITQTVGDRGGLSPGLPALTPSLFLDPSQSAQGSPAPKASAVGLQGQPTEGARQNPRVPDSRKISGGARPTACARRGQNGEWTIPRQRGSQQEGGTEGKVWGPPAVRDSSSSRVPEKGPLARFPDESREDTQVVHTTGVGVVPGCEPRSAWLRRVPSLLSAHS